MVVVPPEYAKPARRLALASAALEVGLKELMESRLGEHGEPYREDAASKFGRTGQACLAIGSALLAARGGRSRAAAIAGGTLLSAGALSARWSVFKAGFQSAADPRYAVVPQRAGIERGDRAGAARRHARVSEPTPGADSPAILAAPMSGA
jgi:hypothetical protein